MYTPIYCEKCGDKFGFWIGSPLVSSKDKKYLCYSCGRNLGLNADMIDFLRKEGYLSRCSRMTYEESLAYLKELNNEFTNALAKYNFSYAPRKEIKFDDSNKVFIILRENIAKKEKYNPWDYVLLKYSQIESFDLIENGSSITSGGLGRAVVGGLLFGGAGAIVGAVTRSYKELCTDLSIKITVKDYSSPAVYLHLVSSDGIMKNTPLYNEYIKIAQDILSKLQLITNSINSSTTVNTTDGTEELRKYKSLLDDGIITEEEFSIKKKQLLGMEPVVINSAVNNSSETINSEYYSVMLTSYNDCKMAAAKAYLQYKHCSLNEAKRIIDSADLPFEIIGTTSKSDAEEVAKKFASAGSAVEIRQPKSSGDYVVIPFKLEIETSEVVLTEEDLAKRIKEDEEDLAKLNNLKEGDTFFFGSYNGQRISWKVLKIQGRKALIISGKIVCRIPYHQPDGNITWSDCTLRKWLNNDFYNGVFTEKLHARILSCQLDNDDNPQYKTPGGASTTDKVFVLSLNEAQTLFANNEARAGDYWWLRSPGENPFHAAYVMKWGEIYTKGNLVRNSVGVRPALWIDLISEKERKEAEEKAEELRKENTSLTEINNNAVELQVKQPTDQRPPSGYSPTVQLARERAEEYSSLQKRNKQIEATKHRKYIIGIIISIIFLIISAVFFYIGFVIYKRPGRFRISVPRDFREKAKSICETARLISIPLMIGSFMSMVFFIFKRFKKNK